MENSQSSYQWDAVFFEQRTKLLSNCQFGFIGIALMLMMMDLSKLYLLIPLAIGLIISSWYKHHLENIELEFKRATLSFSPKSILITKPEQDLEKRVTFREIKEVDLHKQHFLNVVSIYLEDEKVEIQGFAKSEQLVEELNKAIVATASAD